MSKKRKVLEEGNRKRQLFGMPGWSREKHLETLKAIKGEVPHLEMPPEVVGIGFGPKGMTEEELDVPVAKIYVKWMPQKKVEKLKLPSKLAGYEAVAHPVRFKSSSGCSDMDNTWYGEMGPGVNIGSIGNGCGTLGMKLWGKPPFRSADVEYFLTARHLLPDVGTEVWQPGKPSYAAQMNPEQNLVGVVDEVIRPQDIDGEHEVSLVEFYASREYRTLVQEPHAPAYPREPQATETLQIMNAGNMIFDSDIVHYGLGMYFDFPSLG